MVATKFRWLLALLVPAAVLAKDPSPDVRGFKAYELPEYTIVTHDESNARPIPRLAAQIQGALARLLDRKERVPASPTYVVLVPQSVWIRYLRPGQGLESEFVSAKFANYLLMNNGRDTSQLGKSVFHEYSHWFLHTQVPGVQPLWFDEGLAEFVSTAEFRGAMVRLGELDSSWTSRGWIPLDTLFRLDKTSPEYRNLSTSGAVHQGSWAIVHRGLAGDAAFGKQMFAFLDALNAQQPIDAAVQASFGVTASELDKTIHAYLNPGYRYVAIDRFKELRLAVDPGPLQKLPRGRPMSELESLQIIADIMLASGFNADRLPEVADAVRRIAPDSAAEIALRMRIAARAGNDTALNGLIAGIGADETDAALLRGAGLALHERAAKTDREDLSTRALELLDRAIASRSDDAEAVWAHATLAARLKRDMQVAAERIAQLRVKLPASPDLAQASALLHESSGESEMTRNALRDMQRLSKESRMSEWAKSRLEASAGR